MESFFRTETQTLGVGQQDVLCNSCKSPPAKKSICPSESTHLLPFKPWGSIISGTTFLPLENEMKDRVWLISSVDILLTYWCAPKLSFFFCRQAISETDRGEESNWADVWMCVMHLWTWRLTVDAVGGHEVSCPQGQGSLSRAAPGRRVSVAIDQKLPGCDH